MVLSHTHRFINAGKSVFSDEPFLGLAEQEADGGPVINRLDLRIHGGKIKIELAGVIGLERCGLEFDDNVTFQSCVVEKQIYEKLFSFNLDAELTSDESKTGAQLQKESGDVANQGVFDVALMGFVT